MDSSATALTPLLLTSTTSHILSYYASSPDPLTAGKTATSPMPAKSPYSSTMTANSAFSSPSSSPSFTSSPASSPSSPSAMTTTTNSPKAPRFLPPRRLSGRLRALSQEREGGPLRVYTPVVVIAEVADRKKPRVVASVPASNEKPRMLEIRTDRTLDSIPSVPTAGVVKKEGYYGYEREKEVTPARVCPRRGLGSVGLPLEVGKEGMWEGGDWTPDVEGGEWRRMKFHKGGVSWREWARWVVFWTVVVVLWVFLVVGAWWWVMA